MDSPDRFTTLSLIFALLENSEMDCLKGFRFRPTDDEIIHLLKKKRSDPDFSVHTVKETDIYSIEPWDLPPHSDLVSYFFSKPNYKYAKNKRRVHRRTNEGYWKITSNVSDVKAKNSPDVIAKKRILTFYRRTPAANEVKTEWGMHEFYVEDDDPLYKDDFVVCRIKRKRENKHRISVRGEENVSSKSQLLPNHNGISHFGNYVAKNTSPESQLPPNQSSSESHLSPNQYFPELQLSPNQSSPESQLPQSQYSSESQLPPNQILISHPRNHVAKNTSAESQQAPYHDFISYRNDVVEEDSPESQFVPNQNLDNTFQAESPLLEEFYALDGYNGLNDASFSALWSQNYSELELTDSDGSGNGCDFLNSDSVPNHNLDNTFEAESPLLAEFYALDGYNGLNDAPFSSLWSQNYPELELTYSDGFGNGCDFLNFEFAFEQGGDLMNSEMGFQNEYFYEEIGQTLTPDFNSSKSDGGVYVEDSSGMDAEIINAWIDELLADNLDINNSQIL